VTAGEIAAVREEAGARGEVAVKNVGAGARAWWRFRRSELETVSGEASARWN